MMCVDMIVFVIILHGVYSAGIYGLMFSLVLENSLSPVTLLKALLSSSASQPHVSFQNWQLPQRQGGSQGCLTSQFLLDPSPLPFLTFTEVLQKP